MVVDGKSAELIVRMYECACKKYKEENGGNPTIMLINGLDILEGVKDFDDATISVINSVVIMGRLACFTCEAKIEGQRVATAFFGLGEYNEE